jgi:ubiquinone/menaquinone biosynthesis C-methylase UbiE
VTVLPDVLSATLRPDQDARQLEPGLWTVLPDDAEEAEYDSFGRSYDRMVGNRLYLSWVWGSDRDDWTAFARDALESTAAGPLLDVACGSLTFTDEVYADPRRPVVLLDRSRTMLQMARERLERLHATGATLVHGDGFALPFADGAFTTVVSHGSVHVFDDMTGVIRELNRCVAPGGILYLTALVDSGRWLPRWYMGQMRRMGHFGPVRTVADLEAILRDVTGREPEMTVRGSLAYATIR